MDLIFNILKYGLVVGLIFNTACMVAWWYDCSDREKHGALVVETILVVFTMILWGKS